MKQFFYTAIISVFCLVLPQPISAQENLIEKQNNLDAKENLITEKTNNLNSDTPQLNLTSLETADIEPIITAQKQPQQLQDIPFIWNVISEREIKQILINYLGDIAKKIARYNYSPKYERGNELGNYITLQGLKNPKLLTARDRAAFYIDDIPVDYNNFLLLSSVELDRIQVLGIPQSSLVGKNSAGGIVNAIPRQASSEPEVIVSTSYGKYNSRELQFSLNDALVEDKLALRIAGVYEGRNGFIQNIATDEKIGERARFSARGQLLWTPTSDWRISFNSYNSFINDGHPPFNKLNPSEPFKVDINTEGYNHYNTNTQALKVDYQGKGFRATSITARRFSQQELLFPGTTGATQTVDDLKLKLWTQELRFQSPKSAENFQWLLGAYYESQNYIVDDARVDIPGLPEVRRFGDDSRKTYALFGQVDYKPVKPLTLSAGLRYEYSDGSLDSSYSLVSSDGSLSPIRPDFEDEKVSDEELIPNFGLKYQISPNLIGYANIAKGYRPGGLNYGADTQDTLLFEEEKSWNYVVGLQSVWLNGFLLAGLSFFHKDINDYQVLQFDENGVLGDINNIDLKATGVQFALQAKPTPGLDLIASVGYMNSKYENYINSETGIDLSDNQVPFLPQLTYNLAAQYRTPGGLYARAELRGYGLTYFDDDNTIKQEPYALVNARIGYEAEKYGIYLYANNLFDTRYLTSGYLFPVPDGTAEFGDPAIYGIQMKAKF
ncbi:TonB-dependent receptor [Calothrix parasitica NIES-267]|uniref:TonB-dependent receptor n=1 Tax=Calothrix parasitica NIES-267 TaxID=1973488 RepID=A0A1Z4LXB1_9CYAN|nr:TonB-dependent receptor [Calothrix parasitica NIES-267]